MSDAREEGAPRESSANVIWFAAGLDVAIAHFDVAAAHESARNPSTPTHPHEPKDALMKNQLGVTALVTMSVWLTACAVTPASNEGTSTGATVSQPAADEAAMVVPAGASSIALGVNRWLVTPTATDATVRGVDDRGADLYVQSLAWLPREGEILLAIGHAAGGANAQQSFIVSQASITLVPGAPMDSALVAFSEALRIDARAAAEAMNASMFGAIADGASSRQLNALQLAPNDMKLVPATELEATELASESPALIANRAALPFRVGYPLQVEASKHDWFNCGATLLGAIGGGVAVGAVCVESFGVLCGSAILTYASLVALGANECAKDIKGGDSGSKRLSMSDCEVGQKCACFFNNERSGGFFDIGGDYICVKPHGGNNGYNLPPEFKKKTSAVQLFGGATAQVYTGAWLTGPHLQIHKNLPWIGSAWNDKVQSVQVW